MLRYVDASWMYQLDACDFPTDSSCTYGLDLLQHHFNDMHGKTHSVFYREFEALSLDQQMGKLIRNKSINQLKWVI